LDAYPLDASEWTDTDGDGVGDNSDVFPGDASETLDTDGDGVGDNSDAYPYDATLWEDESDLTLSVLFGIVVVLLLMMAPHATQRWLGRKQQDDD